MRWMAIAVLVASLAAPGGAFAHGETMNIGSTEERGGALAVDFEFETGSPTVATASVTVGGLTLHTTLFPSFAWVGPELPSAALFALSNRTPVTMEIVAIEPGVSVRVNGVTLDAAGEATLLGQSSTSAEDHVHPEWQLLLPEGTTSTAAVSFRLTTTRRAYGPSTVYTLRVTNVEPSATVAVPSPTGTPTAAASPTSTLAATVTPTEVPSATATPTASPPLPPTESPTPTPSPSPSPSPVPSLIGDANCDDRLTVADVTAAVIDLSVGSPGRCGADVTGDGVVTEVDVVAIVGGVYGER